MTGLTRDQRIREEERAKLSRTLHEVVTEALSALKVDLHWLQGELASTAGQNQMVMNRIDVMLQSLNDTIGSVRRVATDLRPAVLDTLSEAPRHNRLSDREYQVLLMIAAGKSTRQISAELSLSPKTVGTYRARIFEKMQMKSPAALAAYVVRHGLSE